MRTGISAVVMCSCAALVMCATLRLDDAKMGSEINRKLGSHDSVRKLTLRLLPMMSGARGNTPRKVGGALLPTWILIKLLTPSIRHVRDATGKLSELVNSSGEVETSEHPRLLKRVARRAPVMERFHDDYANFHDSLQEFVELLAERLKPETAESLQNIKLIPDVMPPDALDITRRNVDGIVQKFLVVQDMVQAVLQKFRPFVVPEYADWFRTQSRILKWRMNIVGLAMTSLRVEDNVSEMPILSSGISSSNGGVQLGTSYRTLLKLKDLMKQLHYQK